MDDADRADSRVPEYAWVRIDSNGLAVDPSGEWLYAIDTFTAESAVRAVRITNPTDARVVARLGGAALPPKGLDDMTVDRAGALSVAANASVDPSAAGAAAPALLPVGFLRLRANRAVLPMLSMWWGLRHWPALPAFSRRGI